MIHTARCLLWIALTSTVTAQQTLVVPAAYDNVEAPSAGSIAGFTTRARQQVLIRSSLLGGGTGRSLTAVQVRRDHGLGVPNLGSTSVLRITLSTTTADPGDASPVFDKNRGPDPMVVFDGTVSLPATPIPPTPPAPAPWDAAHSARIVLSTPFPCGTGNLCVEIEGEPITPPTGLFWLVDYEHQAASGTVTTFGKACGGAASMFRSTLGCWARNTVPGGTMTVTAIGQPGSVGLLLVGIRSVVPIPLDAIGATGCSLEVVTAGALVGNHGSPTPGQSWAPLRHRLHIAGVPAFLGGSFALQGIDLETMPLSNPAGITTTNGLAVTLASSLPTGDFAVVESDSVAAGTAFPDDGRVGVGRIPVLRLELSK